MHIMFTKVFALELEKLYKNLWMEYSGESIQPYAAVLTETVQLFWLHSRCNTVTYSNCSWPLVICEGVFCNVALAIECSEVAMETTENLIR